MYLLTEYGDRSVTDDIGVVVDVLRVDDVIDGGRLVADWWLLMLWRRKIENPLSLRLF